MPLAAEFMQTARDILNDGFRSPVAKALIAPWVPHLGSTLDSANSGFSVSLLLSALMAGGAPLPRGGAEMLVKALAQIVTDHGGAIRCDAPVDRILVEGGRAVGVRVIQGDTDTAGRAVIASVNADQLYLRLLADADVPRPIVQQAKRYRYGLGCVQIQLALSEPPDWPDDRLQRVGQPQLLRSMEACALAIAQGMNGDLPSEPPYRSTYQPNSIRRALRTVRQSCACRCCSSPAVPAKTRVVKSMSATAPGPRS